MCGISAISMKLNLSSEQLLKVKRNMMFLGLANNTRGHHGCGIYINGEVIRGLDKEAEFVDFIGKNLYPDIDQSLSSIIISHSRQSTSGEKNVTTTHPIEVPSVHNANKNIIGVHNGSLKNHYTLCTKYEIDHKIANFDTRALYMLIDKVGINILSEYTGAAALIWMHPSDTNTMYVYHGGYYSNHFDKNKQILTEERPMYYLETKEGIYFSSIESSLMAIRDNTEQTVLDLSFNRVFTVTNGVFGSNIKIDREEIELTTSHNTRANNNDYDEIWGDYANTYYGYGYNYKTRNNHNTAYGVQNAYASKKEIVIPEKNIVDDELPLIKSKYVDTVMFYKGRYHLIKDNEDTLCTGIMFIKDRGIVSTINDPHARTCHFYLGVMLRDAKAYTEVMELKKQVYNWTNSVYANFAELISKYSKHPVCNDKNQAINFAKSYKLAWYFDGKKIDSSKFRPEWSGRCYVIEDGFCTEIKPSNRGDIIFEECASIFDKPFESASKMASFVLYDKNKDILLALKNYLVDEFTMSKRSTDDIDLNETIYNLINADFKDNNTLRKCFNDTVCVLDKYYEDAKKNQERGLIILNKMCSSCKELPLGSEFNEDIIDEALTFEEEIKIESNVCDIIDNISDINMVATQMVKTKPTDNFAKSFANKILEWVNLIKEELKDITQKNNQILFEEKIERI
jgi:predicted glutamine amidotransferase